MRPNGNGSTDHRNQHDLDELLKSFATLIESTSKRILRSESRHGQPSETSQDIENFLSAVAKAHKVTSTLKDNTDVILDVITALENEWKNLFGIFTSLQFITSHIQNQQALLDLERLLRENDAALFIDFFEELKINSQDLLQFSKSQNIKEKIELGIAILRTGQTYEGIELEIKNSNGGNVTLKNVADFFAAKTIPAQAQASIQLILKHSAQIPKTLTSATKVIKSLKNSDLTTAIKDCAAICENENFASEDREKSSLLRSLVSSIPDQFSIGIIKFLISKSSDLSKRPDLLETMIAQHTISSDPDMYETFNLLVQKGVPVPSPDRIKELLMHNRLISGNNAGKLAMSFYHIKNNQFLAYAVASYKATSEIMAGQNGHRSSPRNLPISPTRHDPTYHPTSVRRFLLSAPEIQNASEFFKCVAEVVRNNDDELLRHLLSNANLNLFLSGLESHCEILNLAIERKFTKTFEILIDAGFNPQKHRNNEPNPIALACKTQSRKPLEAYFNTLRKKSGSEELFQALVKEKNVGDGNKTALTYAIEGRAYIGAMSFLLDNNADISDNYLQNLHRLARNNHAGAFDLLLKRGDLKATNLSSLTQFITSNCSYVIKRVFLEFLETSYPEASRNQEISSSVTSLKSNISQTPHILQDSDIFEICKTDGRKTLEYYIKDRMALDPSYSLARHVNAIHPSSGKTALYYAIANNSYNSLVKLLLENGADVNCIAYKIIPNATPKKEMNALSLAIKNGEASTLEILLTKSRNLIAQDTINNAATLLSQPENNNNLLTEAFIEHISLNQLKSIPLEPWKILLRRSLESDLYACIYRIRDCHRTYRKEFTAFIDLMMMEAIEKGDSLMVTRLLDQVKAESSLKEFYLNQDSTVDMEDIHLSENSSLINSSTSSSGYNSISSSQEKPRSTTFGTASLKLSQQPSNIDTKYLDYAIELALAAKTPDATGLEDRKMVLLKLIDAQFKSSLPQKEFDDSLRELGLKSFSLCPPDCCIIS